MVDEYDVAIVGYGPVGMVMAALLGQSGRRVVVLERYAGKYNLPRAAIFDDETMRTFAKLGIAERMLPKVHAQRSYEWRNASGELLIEHDFAERGKSGWTEWYEMYQPDLEDALDDLCRSMPSVTIRFDSLVVGISQDNGGVRLETESGTQVAARYVVACDGGNSFVRSALNVAVEDYGFSEPWLVCDFRLSGPVDLPKPTQVCDPAQPISIISLGPDHHRFSFMLGAGEDPEIERQPDRVWAKVAKYLDRSQAELIRAVTYTFRSLVAEHWRVGRIVLAGDAAHQMPPFLGQGMCSGIRDALNLYWKLDMILDGRRDDSILNSYQSERDEHVRAVITKGIELGRIQTMRDPEAAAKRDAELIAKRKARAQREKIEFPPLGSGEFGTGAGARTLMIQGIGRHHGRDDRFDALVGYGPMILADPQVMSVIDDDHRAALSKAGIRLIEIADGDGPEAFKDVEGAYRNWFARYDCNMAAIRPDFHVWGTAPASAEAVNALLEGFTAFVEGEPQNAAI